MWKDAFGRELIVGSKVTYARAPNKSLGGSLIYAVGHIVGPAQSGGDHWVKLELTQATLDLLDMNFEIEQRHSLRSKRTSSIVHSIASVSLIKVNEDIDVLPISEEGT